ncbi:MAG: bifunctional DNA-formamidopyrimidine glycosylase/DNA-(apurinic or apyrimidinic site) lyase [Pelagibacteraceae bacterium]|jgi:formamidopyrimidine-DNA glycosylase
MPELPEVETTIRYLTSKVNGKKILSIQKSSKKLRKNLNHLQLDFITGKTIKKVWRIAKYIIIEIQNQKYLVIHLGMSGRLKYFEKNKYLSEKHDHVLLTFDKFLVVFNDPRRFGMFFMLESNLDLTNFFQHYGVDLLQDQYSAADIHQQLVNKKISLKQALLDQSIFVGIGNIYANEALFHARLDPRRLTNTLKKEEVLRLIRSSIHVLKLSLKNGGSSINDYKSPDGTLGSFQNFFRVYQKSEINFNKRTFPIKKIVQNGRSTFFSPTLQK